MSASDLDCVELELDDEDDEIIDDRCLRNRINDFINSKLRGNLKTNVAKPSNTDRNNNVKHEPDRKLNARKKGRNRNASNKRGKQVVSTSMNNDTLNRDQHSSQIFRREMLFRPVTEIMRRVNRNRPRYTDIVSVEKQRSRRKNRIKQKRDEIIDDASSSDSDAEEVQRTEMLEQFLLRVSTPDSNINTEYW